jgi:hypothetical protein
MLLHDTWRMGYASFSPDNQTDFSAYAEFHLWLALLIDAKLIVDQFCG